MGRTEAESFMCFQQLMTARKQAAPKTSGWARGYSVAARLRELGVRDYSVSNLMQGSSVDRFPVSFK